MYEKYIKRILDILISLVCMPFFVILFIFVAPVIYLNDKGSVFYNANRLGKNGKIFKMYKFRSMKNKCEDIRNSDGSTYNGEEDPRVTRIGKILRKTSIDELPQILNVLKGDMSFIGPRPDLPEHINQYEGNENRKLEIRPGITGYSQAYYRNSIPWKERIENDIYYIDNITFVLDLKIILKTISTVFQHKGVYIKKSQEDIKLKEEEENEYAD